MQPVIDEARRVMNICNACRYCEGLCATFQGMARQRSFVDADLDYLANLCHNCSACYHDCQYSPPHTFDVNVPKVLSELRLDTYQRYAWPGFLARLFKRNGLVVSIATAVLLALTLIVVTMLQDPEAIFGRHVGPGAFYQVISHDAIVAAAGSTFGFSIVAMYIGYVRFRRAIRRPERSTGGLRALVAALRDAATLKYMDGGHGEGCGTRDDVPSNLRRYFHQFTMWGFLLCFAATSVATIYDYGFGLIAPYDFFSVPVLLGTVGGIGLLIGPAGLVWVKLTSDSRPMLIRQYGMDYAFLALLFIISLTGMLLLVLRETAAMGMMLAVHLGFVLGLFVTLPYSKFVHSIYRLAALVRFAED